MSLLNKWFANGRRTLVALVVAVLAIAVGAAITGYNGIANASGAKAAAGSAPGTGEDGYGMTHAYFKGKGASFTYSHGYWCDTSVASTASTKCEVGQKWNNAPAGDHDPLFITVPLGFSPKKMVDCPNGLTCIDHPTTVDLTRLEPALKPLYPQYTDAQLTAALANFATPGHDHFITTKAGGKREWWDVRVVGVLSPKVFKKIQQHKSYSYIRKLIRHKNKNVVGPIPSNIFLFFSVQK